LKERKRWHGKEKKKKVRDSLSFPEKEKKEVESRSQVSGVLRKSCCCNHLREKNTKKRESLRYLKFRRLFRREERKSAGRKKGGERVHLFKPHEGGEKTGSFPTRS